MRYGDKEREVPAAIGRMGIDGRWVAHPFAVFAKGWGVGRVAHPFAPFAKGWGVDALPLKPLRHVPHSHYSLRPLIQLHDTLFSQCVAAIAAPNPLLRFQHQSSLHRIAMHIPQLLYTLALAPDIKIVEPFLPYVWLFLRPQLQLGRTSSLSPQYSACEALLHHLHHRRGRAFRRFADQQMNVLGHHHVTHHHEAIAPMAPRRRCSTTPSASRA